MVETVKQKQVIVVRTDLNMRKGKMIAQGAHAAITATMNAIHDFVTVQWYRDWQNEEQTKVVLKGNSEDHLRDLYAQAMQAKIPCALIEDAGHTEFHGKPTITALAIGPCPASMVDLITGKLELL